LALVGETSVTAQEDAAIQLYGSDRLGAGGLWNPWFAILQWHGSASAMPVRRARSQSIWNSFLRSSPVS
jgi:hypothetical protein